MGIIGRAIGGSFSIVTGGAGAVIRAQERAFEKADAERRRRQQEDADEIAVMEYEALSDALQMQYEHNVIQAEAIHRLTEQRDLSKFPAPFIEKSSPVDQVAALEKLVGLYERGILDEKEFTAQKALILSRIT